jgi:hypothetical protein
MTNPFKSTDFFANPSSTYSCDLLVHRQDFDDVVDAMRRIRALRWSPTHKTYRHVFVKIGISVLRMEPQTYYLPGHPEEKLAAQEWTIAKNACLLPADTYMTLQEAALGQKRGGSRREASLSSSVSSTNSSMSTSVSRHGGGSKRKSFRLSKTTSRNNYVKAAKKLGLLKRVSGKPAAPKRGTTGHTRIKRYMRTGK